MIDICEEQLITLTEAAELFPKQGGRKISLPTLFRWCRRGVEGVILESVRVGRERYTTLQAVQRFLEGLSERERRGGNAARSFTPRGRRRSKQRAEQYLNSEAGS